MSTKAVRVLRDRKRDFPEAGNVRVKAIRRLFRWALDDEVPGVKSNPARDVSYLRGRPGGFHSWTIDEVERYEKRHRIGSTACLALALLLYTGQRRSDIVLLVASTFEVGGYILRNRRTAIAGRSGSSFRSYPSCSGSSMQVRRGISLSS